MPATVKKQFFIREKANPSHVISADWQNASELVQHGFWEWAKGTGAKEFAEAQRLAMKNPGTEGFEKEVADTPVTEDDDSDEEEPAPVHEPEKDEAPDPAPAVPAAAVPELEDMTREELFELAAERGLTVDKRLGTKNLIVAIKAAGSGE